MSMDGIPNIDESDESPYKLLLPANESAATGCDNGAITMSAAVESHFPQLKRGRTICDVWECICDADDSRTLCSS